MWQKFKNFLYTITRSSNDPAGMSMAVRGALIYGAALVIQWAPLVCSLAAALCIDTSQVNPLVDTITKLIESALYAVSYAMVAFGIVRKIWLGRLIHPQAGIQ